MAIGKACLYHKKTSVIIDAEYRKMADNRWYRQTFWSAILGKDNSSLDLFKFLSMSENLVLAYLHKHLVQESRLLEHRDRKVQSQLAAIANNLLQAREQYDEIFGDLVCVIPFRSF